MNLSKAIIVITGGSEGLGLATAKAFVSEGADVHIIGRSQEKLTEAQRILGKTVSTHKADVSNYSQVQAVAKKIKNPQVLINNAGLWLEGSIENNSEAEISQLLDVNLKGVIYTTKAFLPQLLQAQDAHVINVSSTSGLKARNNQAVYAASKFGVTGFTDSLKLDLEKTNIKVSGFYPGGMNTRLFEKAGTPKANSDWMNVEKVAEVIVFMVKQDAAMVLDHVVLNKRNAKTTN